MTRAATVPTAIDTSSFIVEDRCPSTIVDRVIGEVEQYLKRAARYIAADYPAVTADLVQEARITLWELDLGRFTQRDGAYLKRMLCTRMSHAYQSECRGGLTTGWSKHVERDALSVKREAMSNPASRAKHHAPRTGSCAKREMAAR